ncbi:hypothetical protein LTR97_007315 [Elasticomyces elasticus]|uniref:Uncharacterized protein n=1 Tax=Elasticomyces elasticus TaxID=574655 RepID=A0AAN7W667_9PEZI|nr:hypothetical protein LTR97_007315 [Elasticomyces elasticus]
MGGLVDYGGSISGSTTNFTNTYLLYLDLDYLADLNFPVEYANLSKPNNVPSVSGGILWADSVNKVFYQYGGEYNWTSPPPSQYTLWTYDAVYNTWNATGASGIQSVSWGAGTVVDDDRAIGYYYGGWQNNATTLGWNGNPLAQSGLISYDMLQNSWTNTTFIDSTPRAEGALFYIPASDHGMLVYFGGLKQTSNGSYTGVPMNQIYLYDIAIGKYYTQTTSGTAPDMRRRFCGGVSWPDDQSSYNIYFFGGLQPNDKQGVGFGDVWILSIPSFTWTQWYPGLNGSARFSASPGEHHSSSCNIVDLSQMIVMASGGYFPNSSNTDCDAKSIWGQHNLNLGNNNVEEAAWYQYLPNVTSYQVPSTIIDVIGGGPTGGATLTTPAAGWGHQDLAVYFTRSYSATSRTPTRYIPTITSAPPPATSSSVPKHRSSVGPIIGGVIGGIAVLALLILGIWLCLRRSKRKREATSPQPQSGPMTELPGPGSPVSQHKREVSGSTAHAISPIMGNTPPPPPFNASHWSQPQQDYATSQHAVPAAQPFYPPPPQAQQYYPPPPAPAQHESPSPIQEMPSVRSPLGGTGVSRTVIMETTGF